MHPPATVVTKQIKAFSDSETEEVQCETIKKSTDWLDQHCYSDLNMSWPSGLRNTYHNIVVCNPVINRTTVHIVYTWCYYRYWFDAQNVLTLYTYSIFFIDGFHSITFNTLAPTNVVLSAIGHKIQILGLVGGMLYIHYAYVHRLGTWMVTPIKCVLYTIQSWIIILWMSYYMHSYWNHV